MRFLLSCILGGALVFIIVADGAAAPKIQAKTVEYRTPGVVVKGYLAFDEGLKEARPGVLGVHEWWGLNNYARKRARMLAGLGYVALAVDRYGEGRQGGALRRCDKVFIEIHEEF